MFVRTFDRLRLLVAMDKRHSNSCRLGRMGLVEIEAEFRRILAVHSQQPLHCLRRVHYCCHWKDQLHWVQTGAVAKHLWRRRYLKSLGRQNTMDNRFHKRGRCKLASLVGLSPRTLKKIRRSYPRDNHLNRTGRMQEGARRLT